MGEDHIIDLLQAIELRDGRTHQHVVRSEEVDLQMSLLLERGERCGLHHTSGIELTQLFLEEVVVLTG